MEPTFRVVARSVEDENRAKVLQALLNRPHVVAAIMTEVEKQVTLKMESIIWGKKCQPK